MKTLLLLWALAGQDPLLDGVRLLTPEPRTREKIELALPLTPGSANPFDPNAVALDASVRLPSGRTLRVPGFWFQDYRRTMKDSKTEQLQAEGIPEWRVRFSSAEAGEHAVVLELRDGAGLRKSAPLSVKVAPGDGPGFVRASPRNPRYLEHENGRPFFPVGQNLCMSPDREGTAFYERVLPKLAASGANYVRLWQEYYVQGDLKRPSAPGDGSNTGFPLETVPLGIGRYDLECAWKLDAVAALCDKLGIRWQLCFENVVWWNRQMNHRWARNPYNAANGGPCKVPADYLSDPACRELAARRHRYSVARWGWCANLVAWEFWNEVDNLDGFTSAANVAWHQDLGRRLRAVDPYGHLVTSSWRDPAMFALPEIDLVQAHSYWSAEYDAAAYALQDSEHLMKPFGKPYFFGEQGMHEKFDVDPDGHVFHDALWSSSLSGAAGAGMHWHWNTYVDKFDLYRHYAPLAKFLRDVDWPSRDWKAPSQTRPCLPPTLQVYGLVAPDRALVWIHDPLSWRIVKGAAVLGPDQSGASLNLSGLAEGRYRIEFWNTATGEVVGTDSNEVKRSRHFGHGLELKLPDFKGDLAVKILKQGLAWKSP